MGLRINQNIAAMNAYRNLTVTDGQMSKSLEKLSSGFRINRAADDAAGLSISEGLRSQVGGLKVAVRNAQDGISLVQTAEGALTETHALLQRARDLSVQAANTGANDSDARTAASTEVDQILTEVNRIASSTKFGGKTLLDGSVTSGFTFQVGSEAGSVNQVNVSIGSMSATGLGLTGTSAKVSSGDLPASVDVGTADSTGSQTIALTYNTGATGASNVSVTATVAANTRTGSNGDYDMSNASDRSSFESTVQSALDTAAGSAGVLTAKVVSGSTSGTYKLEISTNGTGATSSANVTGGTLIGVGAGLVNIAAGAVTGSGTGSVKDLVASGSDSAITRLDTAIKTVSTQRANLGAYQNRLEHTISNLSVTQENLAASESRIRDADMAQEMVGFTRHQILSQAGTAMLAQANQASQGVLSLLR